MKQLEWFKFIPNAWLTGSIQSCTYEQIGVYINVVSHIMQSRGKLFNDRKLHLKLRLDATTCTEYLALFLEHEMLYEKDGYLSVDFLDEQLEIYSKKCITNKENANKPRGADKEALATASHSPADASDSQPNKNKNKNKIKNNKNTNINRVFEPMATIEDLPVEAVDEFKKTHSQAFLTFKATPEEEYKYCAWYLACNMNGVPTWQQNPTYNPSKMVSLWMAKVVNVFNAGSGVDAQLERDKALFEANTVAVKEQEMIHEPN